MILLSHPPPPHTEALETADHDGGELAAAVLGGRGEGDEKNKTMNRYSNICLIDYHTTNNVMQTIIQIIYSIIIFERGNLPPWQRGRCG